MEMTFAGVRQIYFGEAGESEEYEVIASYLAEFLIVYAHQMLHSHRRAFPRLVFVTRAFDGLAVKRCARQRVADYIDRVKKSLVRWLLNGSLKVFCVEICHVSKRLEFQYQVRFPRPILSGISDHATPTEITIKFDALKCSCRRALFELQTCAMNCPEDAESRKGCAEIPETSADADYSTRPEPILERDEEDRERVKDIDPLTMCLGLDEDGTAPIYLRIICALRDGRRPSNRYGEHAWRRALPNVVDHNQPSSKPEPHTHGHNAPRSRGHIESSDLSSANLNSSQIASFLPACDNISCEIAQFHFIHIKRPTKQENPNLR